MSKAARTLRVVTGQVTPFLRPWWEQEFDLAEAWLAGQPLDDVRPLVAMEIARMLGGGDVVLVDSGRAALRLALAASCVGPGDHVALTAYSCAGVITPVLDLGSTPVLVDIDHELNMDLPSLQVAHAKYGLRAAIVPHLGGVWSRGAAAIVEWGRARGVMIVEDVAQSTGLTRDGTEAGGLADVSITSTGRGKPLFGPAGGALVSRSPAVTARAHQLLLPPRGSVEVEVRLRRFLRRYPRTALAQRRAEVAVRLPDRLTRRDEGAQRAETLPTSMTEIDAGLALAQLRRLEQQIALRRAAAARWASMLAPLRECGLEHAPLSGTSSKFWVSATTEQGHSAVTALRRAARDGGVEIEPLYTPLHIRPEFSRALVLPTPQTDVRWRHTFSLPTRPGLSDADWKRMVAVARRAAE